MRCDVGLVAHNVVDQDGQGRAMVELARALVAAGHTVTVYSRQLAPDLEGSVTFHRLPRDLGVGLLDDFFILAAASRAVRRGAHQVALVIGPCALPRRPFVYEAQFSQAGWRQSWDATSTPSPYHRLHNRTAGWLERLVLRRAAALMPTTARLAQEVAPRAGPPVVVVPNGVDVSEYQPVTADERAAARDALGIPADAYAVGFLGEYHTGRKGLGPLVEAVAEGGEHLLVGGSGNTDWLSAHAAECGAGERVHALGFRRPRDVIAAADVVAVPSLYEPFSLVALEASASGVPVVISHVAGAAEYLRDGAIVLSEPRDAAEIRAALDRLADPAVRAAMGRAARADAERLAWPVVMTRAVRLLERLAGGAPPDEVAADLAATGMEVT